MLLGSGENAEAQLGRKGHRHRHQHQQRHARAQRRHDQRTKHHHDAQADACIPTGQACPSKKPRGKKGRKLGCDKCCQGSFITEASGKKVCGCRPNGGSCTTATAASCCSGFCNGSTCQAAPCSTAFPCPQCQTCNGTTGLCEAVSDGTACDDGNACTQASVCQSGVCTGGSPLACTTPPICHVTENASCNPGNGHCTYPTQEPNLTVCDTDKICCGGDCVEGSCCANSDCAGTPTTPVCGAAHTCVACTSTSHCPADHICLLDDSCHACDVICTGTPDECGQALQAKIDGGGTFYVCAGAYRPPSATGFLASGGGVTLIGAGEGESPASNTVLDANLGGRVLNIASGAVDLQRLRVTGGQIAAAGGGIVHAGTTLAMTECTVAGNSATGQALGGGIAVGVFSSLHLTRCTVRDNHAGANGGGILARQTTTLIDCLVEANTAGHGGGGIVVNSGTTRLQGQTRLQGNHAAGGGGIYTLATVIIDETCRVTQNTATASPGGGINNDGGTVTLLGGTTPSPIVVDNCPGNCAGTVPTCSTAPPSGPCP